MTWWISVVFNFYKPSEKDLLWRNGWIGSGTYPDFKSVILKQFVASSPTFPLRTTLDMNGESIGEIRFKATSGDILTCLANHHWKKKERMMIRISKLLDITIFLETGAVHRSVSCLIPHLLSYGSLLQWPSKSLSHYCSPVLWQPLAVTLQKPISLLLTYSRHRLFRRSSNPLNSNCLPLFKASFYAATLYLKAALLCLTTGRSFLLKKGLLTILSPNTQSTHIARLGVPRSPCPHKE